VVEVRGEHHELVLQRRIAAWQDRHDVRAADLRDLVLLLDRHAQREGARPYLAALGAVEQRGELEPAPCEQLLRPLRTQAGLELELAEGIRSAPPGVSAQRRPVGGRRRV
jgi:hypothetical protein